MSPKKQRLNTKKKLRVHEARKRGEQLAERDRQKALHTERPGSSRVDDALRGIRGA